MCLQVDSFEKYCVTCGPEVGIENEGKMVFLARDIQRGKSEGRCCRIHLRSCLSFLDFESCLADPDVWMRSAVKADSTECYENILLCADDDLVVNENSEKVLRKGIGKCFDLKPESVGIPSIFLGRNVRNVMLENGVHGWGFSSSQCS